MTQETKAQIRLSDQFSFSFDGAEAENEAAHISNMTNNMLPDLRAIRIEALAYQSNHGVTCLRKCPHCGQVWTKVEGCGGTTTCGAMPSKSLDVRDDSFTVMATFTFAWDELTEKLTITQSGLKSAQIQGEAESGAGCGRSIDWSAMATVQLPSEFDSTLAVVKTSDVSILPPSASNFNDRTDERLASSLGQMTLGPRPTTSTPGAPTNCVVCLSANRDVSGK